jgi:hypothetical protein
MAFSAATLGALGRPKRAKVALVTGRGARLAAMGKPQRFPEPRQSVGIDSAPVFDDVGTNRG